MFSRRPRPTLLIVGVMLFFFAGLPAGCSDDSSGEDDECTTDEQCADNETCRQGACVVTEQSFCAVDDDCPSGPYECIENLCQRQTVDAGDDVGEPNNNTPDADDTGEEGDDVFEDPSDDEDPPQVESVEPAGGTTGVSVDSSVEITFNEDMDPVTINFFSVQLRDSDNRKVDTIIEYDEASRTATMTPEEPLHAATGYRVKVDAYARDQAGNGLAPQFEATFYTADDAPQPLVDLAERFAPVIYQGIADTEGSGPNADIPTRIDFDQNLTAADNAASAQSGQTPAHVYYHVSESSQYYFLHYILYYPARVANAGDAPAEHDFAGAIFVVDKATEDLLLVEGVRVGSSGEVTVGYKPQGSPISLSGGGASGMSLDSFDPATLESGDDDGTHYPMYVPAGDHETCHWHESGSNGRCLHSPGEFRGDADQGVVLRAGDSAQSFDEATLDEDSGLSEMNYELVPFSEGFWAYRGSYAEDGLFEVPFIYSPLGEDRPIGFDQDNAHVLPRRLQSNATASYGHPPFSWLPSTGADNDGQWMLDPVYVLPNRYNFGQTVSTHYCYNSFFGIDLRGDANVEGCEDN